MEDAYRLNELNERTKRAQMMGGAAKIGRLHDNGRLTARELITALARLNGHVIGLIANNPLHNAGAMGPGACDKASSFIVRKSYGMAHCNMSGGNMGSAANAAWPTGRACSKVTQMVTTKTRRVLLSGT